MLHKNVCLLIPGSNSSRNHFSANTLDKGWEVSSACGDVLWLGCSATLVLTYGTVDAKDYIYMQNIVQFLSYSEFPMIPSIPIYMLLCIQFKENTASLFNSLNQPLEMVAIVTLAHIQKPVVIHVVHNVPIKLNNLGF